ncbi:MAG TPA: sigma-70 family RNA polymerase sigma factor [Planctomycetota bacterium]|nr:sigma-70 family RNA polymerase sigma factor [Planctomycetota bacterium]
MDTREGILEVRRRGTLLLSDLDRWVDDPAAYETKKTWLVRTLVKHDVALFPGQAAAASLARAATNGADAPTYDLYAMYVREIRRIPPMERDEEFRYVLALEIAKGALECEIRRPRISSAELAAFEKAVDSHDPTFHRMLAAARARATNDARPAAKVAARVERVRARFQEMLAWKRVLVYRTLPLVPGMARRYRGMGVPLMDLIQEANTSLMKATDRYEWRKGVRFVVYARWWVQQGVLKSLSCHSRTVRTPVYLAQKLKKIRDLNDFAYMGSGERLSPEQIGRALDEPVARVQRALAAAKLTVSIDQELDSGGEFSLREILADPHGADLEDAPPGAPLGTRIEALLNVLSERERLVLELRYGLHHRAQETLDGVSKRLGVSRERVRQIQEQALKKLQGPSKRLHLAAFLPG